MILIILLFFINVEASLPTLFCNTRNECESHLYNHSGEFESWENIPDQIKIHTCTDVFKANNIKFRYFTEQQNRVSECNIVGIRTEIITTQNLNLTNINILECSCSCDPRKFKIKYNNVLPVNPHICAWVNFAPLKLIRIRNGNYLFEVFHETDENLFMVNLDWAYF